MTHACLAIGIELAEALNLCESTDYVPPQNGGYYIGETTIGLEWPRMAIWIRDIPDGSAEGAVTFSGYVQLIWIVNTQFTSPGRQITGGASTRGRLIINPADPNSFQQALDFVKEAVAHEQTA